MSTSSVAIEVTGYHRGALGIDISVWHQSSM